ncbi:MAG TPA: hypothetical protein VJY62_13280, partial [Bacteroidia bacterium]|nr:hypothetical protein [Bacteroidia bacterium]
DVKDSLLIKDKVLEVHHNGILKKDTLLKGLFNPDSHENLRDTVYNFRPYFIREYLYYLEKGKAIEFPSFITLYKKRNPVGIERLFDAISGLINAMAFSLLISRLDSKFFGLQSTLIALLFLYAALQPFYSIFHSEGGVYENLKSITIAIAFLLKIILFLILLYLLEMRRFHTYFFCFRELDRRADAVYDNQFEIVPFLEAHVQKYSFYILNKDKKVFKTDRLFESHDLCIDTIERMQKVIGGKEKVFECDIELEKDKGAHILYLWFEGFKLYSKDFENEEEKHNFEIDAAEKLPYCKISFEV